MRGMEPTQLAATDPGGGRTNEAWAVEVCDLSIKVAGWEKIQMFSVMAFSTRLILASESGLFVDGKQIADALDRVAAKHGYPKVISTDRGKAFSTEALRAWADKHGVKHHFRVGHKPTDDSSLRALQTLQNELRGGTSKVEAPGLKAEYAKDLEAQTLTNPQLDRLTLRNAHLARKAVLSLSPREYVAYLKKETPRNADGTFVTSIPTASTIARWVK